MGLLRDYLNEAGKTASEIKWNKKVKIIMVNSILENKNSIQK